MATAPISMGDQWVPALPPPCPCLAGTGVAVGGHGGSGCDVGGRRVLGKVRIPSPRCCAASYFICSLKTHSHSLISPNPTRQLPPGKSGLILSSLLHPASPSPSSRSLTPPAPSNESGHAPPAPAFTPGPPPPRVPTATGGADLHRQRVHPTHGVPDSMPAVARLSWGSSLGGGPGGHRGCCGCREGCGALPGLGAWEGPAPSGCAEDPRPGPRGTTITEP